jgi:Tfp pilus assembly protein PilE
MSRIPHGFSLVDVVVGVALMLVLFLSLFGVLKASLVLSSISKAKSAATELANTQMEYLHGLAYDSVGTVGGIPSGVALQNATTSLDGVTYTIHTYVEYTDSPADGTGASDTNGVTTDYKTGKVSVSYTLYGLTNSVSLVSNFVPTGIEATTGGGTISIHVVNKDNVGVGDAIVQIINASTSPSINFSTFSDTSGYVMVGGAATSSQYQIYVSRAGYSSAQTYARAGQNANPTPGYLTISQNQTTSSTFAIDLLSSLILSVWSPAVTSTFSDTFASAANLVSETSTQVAGGALTLASEALSGSALSTTTAPGYLSGWGLLQATLATPSGTTAVVQVGDASGTPLPDAALPGNGAGFSSFPVSLVGVSTTTYPALTLTAVLTSNATTTAPSVLDWSLSYTAGPTPLPNSAFTLTGTKTIGTTAGGAVIYKTILNDTSGSTGTKTEILEWDAYTPSYAAPVIDSCPAAPYVLLPGTTAPASVILGAPSATTLPVVVVDTLGDPVSAATVILSKSDYAATISTTACGTAFFNGLTSGTYSATVAAGGHTTTVFPNISVAGHTATSTLTLP